MPAPIGIEEIDCDVVDEGSSEVANAGKNVEDLLQRLKTDLSGIEGVWESKEAKEYQQKLNDLSSKFHLFNEEITRYANNGKAASATYRAAAEAAKQATAE